MSDHAPPGDPQRTEFASDGTVTESGPELTSPTETLGHARWQKHYAEERMAALTAQNPDDPFIAVYATKIAEADAIITALTERGEMVSRIQREAIQTRVYKLYLSGSAPEPRSIRPIARPRSFRAPRRSGAVRRRASSSSPSGSRGADDSPESAGSRLLVGFLPFGVALKLIRNAVAASAINDYENARDHALGLVLVAQVLAAMFAEHSVDGDTSQTDWDQTDWDS